MAYEVTVNSFSGPLDLLLHLIQKQEVSIHDVSIALVTEQYLEYLHAMEELSLEIASEFIVMAATLLAIKSRMLLPRPVLATNPEDEIIDEREALIQQLIDYQQCRWAADELKQREVLQSQVFTRNPEDLGRFAHNEPPELVGLSIWDLVDAFRKIQRRIPPEPKVAEITGKVIDVKEVMDRLLDKIRSYKHCTFDELLSFATTRPDVVAGFLALLELVKGGLIGCRQGSPFLPIEVFSLEATA